MAEQWLSIVEYARTYKVSDMTVRRRIKTGKLEAVLQDGKYFIPITPSTMPKNTPPAAALSEADFSRESEDPLPGSASMHTSRHPEIRVIKGHPTAPRVYPEPTPKPLVSTSALSGALHTSRPHSPGAKDNPQQNPSARSPAENEQSLIPASIRQSLIQYETSLIDSHALLSFCDGALRKAQDSERKTVDRFKSKLEALEATLGSKEQEIKHLRQQLEDLQLLVKILERRKAQP